MGLFTKSLSAWVQSMGPLSEGTEQNNRTTIYNSSSSNNNNNTETIVGGVV